MVVIEAEIGKDINIIIKVEEERAIVVVARTTKEVEDVKMRWWKMKKMKKMKKCIHIDTE